MFFYQPKFRTLHLKDEKGTYKVFSRKSKEIYKSELNSLHTTFAPDAKYFRYGIKTQFSKTPLIVQQKHYSTKIVNPYIVDDLDYWPLNPLNNFTLKYYL